MRNLTEVLSSLASVQTRRNGKSTFNFYSGCTSGHFLSENAALLSLVTFHLVCILKWGTHSQSLAEHSRSGYHAACAGGTSLCVLSWAVTLREMYIVSNYHFFVKSVLSQVKVKFK